MTAPLVAPVTEFWDSDHISADIAAIMINAAYERAMYHVEQLSPDQVAEIVAWIKKTEWFQNIEWRPDEGTELTDAHVIATFMVEYTENVY